MEPISLRISQIVGELGGEWFGPVDLSITGIAPLDAAQAGDIAFLSHPKYQGQLASSQAGCVIVSLDTAAVAQKRGACIVCANPYLYFARLTQWWRRLQRSSQTAGVHPSAVIDPAAKVDPSAVIGPLCVVERGAVIGPDTRLYSRVTVGEDCRIGARCILHPGVVIGADGFGFAKDGDQWVKIEQLGAVVVGNDVEIGANTCIDRGALQDTVIEDGVKLDNLIQIGHNVRVGRNTAMAGCAGVAGSATIGANCTVGGGAIVLGHLQVAEGVHISAATVVTRSIRQPGQYTGMFPIDDNASWEKNAASLKQLHSLRERVRALEQNQT